MACSRVARVWDSLREGNILNYELLACSEDRTILKLVGEDLMPTALLEKEVGQEVLDFKLHNIKNSGLPTPPPPTLVMPSLAPLPALGVARKPFQLPKKCPEVTPREATTPLVNIDQSEKKRKIVHKCESLLEALWVHFISLGKFGALWNESFSNPSFRAEAKAVLMDDWSKCKQLKQHLSDLDAWIIYTAKIGEDWKTPNSISIRAFLATYKNDGAYVPKRYFDSLRWLQTNIGLNATTELYRVRRSADAPGSHVPTQANPLKASVITIISNAMFNRNIFISALACFWNLLVSSAVRPRHLQRSALDLSGRYIIGHATAGKIRTMGLQRPFKWACPAKDMANADLKTALINVTAATKCANHDYPFIMPEFFPPRSDWSSAKGFTDKPMELPKILRLMGLYLRSQGLPIDELDHITGLYSGRRVQPTIADFSQKPVEFRLDIGDWADKSARDRVAMPNLYSAARLHTQVNRKKEMLVTANLALSNYMANEENPSIHPSWDVLFQFWPEQKTIDAAMNISMPSSSSAKLAITDHGNYEQIDDEEFWNGLLSETTKAADSEDAYTISDPESEADMDLNAEDEIFPSAAVNLKWQLSSGKHGRLHALDGMCLACSRTLRRPEEGTGLSQALSTGRVWSPRCWASLSPAVQQWWSASSHTE